MKNLLEGDQSPEEIVTQLTEKEVYQVRLGINKTQNNWEKKLNKVTNYLDDNRVSYDTETFDKVKNVDATFEDRREAEEFESMANDMGIYSETETLNI